MIRISSGPGGYHPIDERDINNDFDLFIRVH
jgi:hypothetical protein